MPPSIEPIPGFTLLHDILRHRSGTKTDLPPTSAYPHYKGVAITT